MKHLSNLQCGAELELNGVPVRLASVTYSFGVTVEEVLAKGTTSRDSELFTSDGRSVGLHAWCQCEGDALAPDAPAESVYYHDRATGSHGWACGSCRLVAQTG